METGRQGRLSLTVGPWRDFVLVSETSVDSYMSIVLQGLGLDSFRPRFFTCVSGSLSVLDQVNIVLGLLCCVLVSRKTAIAIDTIINQQRFNNGDDESECVLN